MNRRHDLDALRVIAFGLLILYHAGMLYVADWDFHLKSTYLSEGLQGGMIALMKSLALTLGRHGITVNALNPGVTDTPLARAAITEWDAKMKLDVLGTCSQPEDIAETVLFLAGTAGRFMTGQLVSVRMRYGA